MSIVAICPVASLLSTNAALEAQGFGPNNFSVPAYTGSNPTHAALHCWDNPAFEAALAAIPAVTMEVSDGDPVTRTLAMIESQNAKWGAQAAELPDGPVTAGELYRYGDNFDLWYVIQSHNRAVYGGDPAQYPALIRQVKEPGKALPWKQPIDAFDAYKLVNPFTGKPDRCTHNGQTWEVTQADGAGNNVWEPGVFGWTAV